MCTAKQQNMTRFRAHIEGRTAFGEPVTPEQAAQSLEAIGGMAGTWRTDYSECTYTHPQRIDGVLVDLSAVENIRAHHERIQ